MHSDVRAELMRASAATLSVGLALWTVGTAIEAVLHGSMLIRTVMFSFIALSTLAFGLVTIGRVLWYRVLSSDRPGIDSIAQRVGAAYQDIRDMLLNAMQLLATSSPSGLASDDLRYAAFEGVEKLTRDRDFSVVIDRRTLRRFLMILLLAMSLTGSLMIYTPMRSASERLLHFRSSFVPPAPFSLRIEPLQAYVLRGEKITIYVKAEGKVPQSISLQLKEEQQQNYDAYTLREDSTGSYHFEIGSLKRSIEFFAEVPWYSEAVRTPIGRVVVTDRPLIRSLDGRVTQPSYTNREAISLSEQNADITALSGSRVDLTVAANKELASANIVLLRSNQQSDSTRDASQKLLDTTRIPMAVQDRSAKAGFTVSYNGLYWIELFDKDGRTNPDPIRYSIVSLADGYPSISLIEPSSDVQLGKDALLNMKIGITDDYGFSQLLIHYRLAESRYTSPDRDFKAVPIPLGSIGTSAQVPYLWDLNKLGISPEDRYEFYVEVLDNDRVHGPKSAKTSTMTLRLPSLDEVFRQAKQTQNDAAKELEQVMKKADDVARDMEQLQREMMKQQQKQADWKDKKKMEELLHQQDQIQDKIKDVQNKLEEMTQMLEENKAISPETLQKYAELQKLMQKIDSKELRDAMEQMQKAMQQMSPEQMQQAMKNFKFSEEDFRKQIERTMQLLKRIQTEQKVDELAKRARDLQKQQEELQRQSENTNPNDKNALQDLAKKQEALKEDLAKMSQEMKELEKMAKEAGLDKQQNVMDEMKKAMDQLNAEMTEKQMDKSEKDLEKGDMKDAQQNMRNAAQNLKNFSQGMKQMKKEMKKNLQRETAKQLQSSMNDMMSMSKAEEQLMKESQKMDMNSSRMSQNAREQQKLREQMANLANKMNQLGQKTTAVSPEMGKEMGDAMRQMQGAQESMESRNSPSAAMQQQGAMASMNRAMQQMSQALQQMNGGNPGDGDGEGEGDPNNPNGQKPGGKGSFMQRLQQAANQQQGINQGMQQLGQGGQGMSQEQQGQLGRLAAQQGRVQKSLDELAHEQKEASGNKKALGDLEKLADEMKEVLSDMQSGHITEETKRRQDRILSRLLDASRSMNERDYEKTRESRAGQDTRRNSPAELNLEALRNKQAIQDLLKSMQQGYTKDYEQLIRQYFDQLQKNAPTR